jgi:hypothetical protein
MVFLRAYWHIVPPPDMKYRNRKAQDQVCKPRLAATLPRPASLWSAVPQLYVMERTLAISTWLFTWYFTSYYRARSSSYL